MKSEQLSKVNVLAGPEGVHFLKVLLYLKNVTKDMFFVIHEVISLFT